MNFFHVNFPLFLEKEEMEEKDMEYECPADKPLVMCFADPCQIEFCNNHPDAMCTVNLCGECSAVFRHKDGTVVEQCEGLIKNLP